MRSTNPYSHCRRGPRPDIRDGKISFRSAWEANYARYLEWLKARGEIFDWSYETAEFQFPVRRGPAAFYIPDFEVLISSNLESTEYHEIKGYMSPTSKAKLRRMKKYYSNVPVVLVDAKAYHAIEETFGSILPNWEGFSKRLYGRPPRDKK